MKVSQFYPHDIEIDGELVRFRIKRMTVEEHIEFKQRARKNAEPTYVRFISREPDGIEQERDENGQFKIPLEKLADQKILALSLERRAEFEAELEKDEERAREFLKYVFGNFITCAGGLIEDLADGTEQTVKDGLDVLRIFGARDDVLGELMAAVRIENELSPEQKKIYKSASDFMGSLSERGRDPHGPKPATIAASAAIEDCAALEVATPEAETETDRPGRSGSTETFSSDVARSDV